MHIIFPSRYNYCFIEIYSLFQLDISNLIVFLYILLLHIIENTLFYLQSILLFFQSILVRYLETNFFPYIYLTLHYILHIDLWPVFIFFIHGFSLFYFFMYVLLCSSSTVYIILYLHRFQNLTNIMHPEFLSSKFMLTG